MNFDLFEKARMAYMKKFLILNIIYLAIFAILIAWCFFGYNEIILCLTLLIDVFVLPLSYRRISNSFFGKEQISYRGAYKKSFVVPNMQKIFTDLSYNYDSGIDKASLDATGMIDTGDVFISDDYVTGKYHNIIFSYANVTIKEESDGNDVGFSTSFVGQWLIFELPNKFAHRIEIIQHGFSAYKIPKPDQYGREFKDYRVESPIFLNKFRLLADDGFGVNYTLNPDLIHNIEQLSSDCKSKLMFCFVDNNLFIGLHNYKKVFEPPLPLKKNNTRKENDKINSQIKVITDFVDYLKLDKNIFTN